jgi:hypothetical protein
MVNNAQQFKYTNVYEFFSHGPHINNYWCSPLIQLVDKFSGHYKELTEKKPYLKKAIFWISMALIIIGGIQAVVSYKETKKYAVYASPSELKMEPRMNKPFTLTITNNNNFAIYDINFSICLDNESIDNSIIEVVPVQKDSIPNVPFSLMGVDLSNACSTIVFPNISPHSSKDFYVTINGEKVNTPYRISFLVYDWALAPSLFSVSTTKDQPMPKNLGEYFKEKSAGQEKNGKTTFQLWKAPVNPYFPDPKESKIKTIKYYQN